MRKSEPKRSNVELTEIAEDALGIAEIEAQRLGIKIESNIEPGLPSVYADRIMIEQVLLNLVKNAAEAEIGPTALSVAWWWWRRDGGDRRPDRCIQVTDMGHGIGEADREKLFSAFFSTKPEGMGMGLNICRSIIEFHNGRLWVDPNPKGGSIFKFSRCPWRIALSLNPSPSLEYQSSDQLVHIIDDDDALRDSLVWLLESTGLKVASYPSAETFLQVWSPALRGCLILDSRMPGMSGLELHDKHNSQHSTLPVIFITGHGDVPMAVTALKKGAFDFIEKPFHDQDMLNLIEQCLARDRSQHQHRRQGADAQRHIEQLTPREREVLELIVAGRLWTNRLPMNWAYRSRPSRSIAPASWKKWRRTLSPNWCKASFTPRATSSTADQTGPGERFHLLQIRPKVHIRCARCIRTHSSRQPYLSAMHNA